MFINIYNNIEQFGNDFDCNQRATKQQQATINPYEKITIYSKI